MYHVQYTYMPIYTYTHTETHTRTHTDTHHTPTQIYGASRQLNMNQNNTNSKAPPLPPLHRERDPFPPCSTFLERMPIP